MSLVREADQNVRCPITTVTVLEDRASVRRRGVVVVPEGTHSFVLRGVAATLLDKTMVATLEAPEPLAEGVRVRNVRIERRRAVLDSQRPQGVVELLERIRGHRRACDRLRQAGQAAELRAQSLRELVSFTLDEANEDVALGRTGLETVGRSLQELREAQASAGAECCRLEQELARAERTLESAEASLRARALENTELLAAIFIDVVNPTGAPVEATLQVEYIAAAAMWRPCHVAELEDASPEARVRFRTEACVWQATGEAWEGVELRFSTERPSLGARPPSLRTDALTTQARSTSVDAQQREQTIATVGEGVAPPTQSAEEEVPGVDDGGEPVSLPAEHARHVASDGRPCKVPLFSFAAPAQVELICAPELTTAILRRSTQPHRGNHPILAGPVDLIRNGGFVGRTSVLFVASGETFELGWGPESALRVHRERTLLEPARKALSAWTRKPRVVAIKLSNLGPTPVTVALRERVIVSELEKVEVELDALDGGTADDDGIVRWQVPVRGFGRTSVELRWTLVVHDDVRGL